MEEQDMRTEAPEYRVRLAPKLKASVLVWCWGCERVYPPILCLGLGDPRVG